MKKSILLIFISLCVLVSGCAQKVSEEQILAKFDNQVVTISELEKEISELPEWRQNQYKDQAGREEYLTLMAESRMLLQVANERKLNKHPDVVKQVKEYQNELMRDALVKKEVDDQVKIDDADLEKYYADHKADYVEPERVVVTEITLKDEATAKEVMEKIKAGADFTELAKEIDAKGESFGPGQGNEGKTRPFSRDSYSSARTFVETAFSLEPNKISDIIVQPLGQDTYYMIIRQDERIPSRQKEFSEVKDDIKGTLEREKKEERKNQWLGTLKKEKKFEIFADKIPKVAETKEEKVEQGEQKIEQVEPSKDTTEEEKPDAK